MVVAFGLFAWHLREVTAGALVLHMNGPTAYPIQDFGPVMKGMVIGGMGIVHVFLAQFAIGGGVLMSYFEWRSGRHQDADARLFLDGFFKVLVLASFVLGAMTGVGMWLTSIQISPQTIGQMVATFHWVWAIEWTFFCVEVCCGYVFYRYGAKLGHLDRLRLLVLYSLASYGSLFWINGILSWQLTPGDWILSRSLWDGFFNPSFWPSLLFRTVACLATAGLVAAVVIDTMSLSRERRHTLLRSAIRFLTPMVLMPVLAIWYLWTMPEDSREWVLGGSPAMNLFFIAAVGASLLIALYAMVGLLYKRLYMNGATALLLLALAFGASAGGEFVREGARKPFSIRQVLYSNAIRPDAVARMRREGSVANDPYPLRDGESYPTKQLALGARVYRAQCSVCHTLSGANNVIELTKSWDLDQQRLNIAKLQHTKGFMPPFAGPPSELEALVQMLRWRAAHKPKHWPVSDDPAVMRDLQRMLDEATTLPGSLLQRRPPMGKR